MFVSVAILYNPLTDSFLLQHRDGNAGYAPHKWGLFGGHGEEGETPLETLLRELKEELDVDVAYEQVEYFTDYQETAESGRYLFILDWRLPKEKMTLLEGDDFEWVSSDKVLEYDLEGFSRKDMELYFERNSPTRSSAS